MKIQFLALLLLISGCLFAQTNVYFNQKNMTYPQKAGIYETEEDFMNDSVKYVGEYNQEYLKIKLGFLKQAYDGTVNFGDKFYKYSEANFFGYKDDLGNRYRIMNGGSYLTMCAGEIWLYSIHYSNNLVYDAAKSKKGKKIRKYGACGDTWLKYSLGKSTDTKRIKKWNKMHSDEANKELFISDPEISKQYMSDERDDYDPSWKNGCVDHMERIIFYAELYNKKHKK